MDEISKDLANAISHKVSPKALKVAEQKVKLGFSFCVPMIFQGKVWMKDDQSSLRFSINFNGNIG